MQFQHLFHLEYEDLLHSSPEARETWVWRWATAVTVRARVGESEQEERKGHPPLFGSISANHFFFVNTLLVCLFPVFNSFHQVFTEHLCCARLSPQNKHSDVWTMIHTFKSTSFQRYYLPICVLKTGITSHQFLGVWTLWMTRSGTACWECFSTEVLCAETLLPSSQATFPGPQQNPREGHSWQMAQSEAIT